MIVFNHPVDFRQMGNTDETVSAEIMMMLAIDGSEKHLEFLSGVMAIFSEGSVMERIRFAKSKEDVCEVLNEFPKYRHGCWSLF